MLSPTHYSHSRKKRKFFSRKKIQHGGQIVPVNSLETHVYVNISVTSPNTITVQNITSPLVQTIATNTPGSVVLSVNPSLSTLKDYTLFGYNGTTWVEIPRTNLDMGGNTVALYGNVPGMLLRKQSGSQDKMASVEVSIPVPVSTYGNVMQFVNIATSIFPFTLASSAETFSANVYIQLVFVDTYPTANTKLSGFLPKYIPGLNLWLNASEPGNNTFTPNTGVKMLNWTDKSGQNNHASAQTATAPIYRSLPGGVGMGMYFNGSTFLSGNLKNTGKYSYTFVVARPEQTNNPIGRLLSLGAPAVDDSSSNASMGVSASSGVILPTQKIIVMGLGDSGTGVRIKYSLSPTTVSPTTTAESVLTWIDADCNWNTGACCSIAYGMGIFVAVGYTGNGGVIEYSSDGIVWLPANMTFPGNTSDYGFGFNSADRDTLNGGGGIRTVIFTGSIWICGGVNVSSFVGGNFTSYRPGLAYSYDGIKWYRNMTTLPFTGTGNCITSIASDGNLIILSGVLTPSMSYSYNGINWFNMPPGVKSATQVGNTPNTGIHCVSYHPELKLWMAGGDGGSNTRNRPTLPESNRKIVWSVDGFNWNMTTDDFSSKIPVYTFRSTEETSTSGTYIRDIFPLLIFNRPHYVLSGPYITRDSLNMGGTGEKIPGPIVSSYSNTSPFGISLDMAVSTFPEYQSSPVEVSAVYFDGRSIYYGLQNPSDTTYLIRVVAKTGINELVFDGPNINVGGITAPVNAIVDNMSGDKNFKGSIHLNNTNLTHRQQDTDAAKPYMITAWEDGMNTCVAVNGTIIPQNKVNPGRFNISSYMIGKNVGSTLHNYTGYICEILVYNSLLYSSSRFAIEGYLAWKWGIQQFLPSSHKYSRNSPSTYTTTTRWPQLFSDLQPLLWLDAQDPNANESFAPEERTFIKTWYDKSGNENHLTAPTYSEPMYTKNIVKAGGIQFNRYAYKSMSYVPFSLGGRGETFPTTGTKGSGTSNTAYDWISGFAIDIPYASNWNVTNDSYNYIYISAADAMGARLFQYDEVNNQTRVILHLTNINYITSVYVSPTNGHIYLCTYSTTTAASLYVLIPNSFPPNSTTLYSTLHNPNLQSSSGETLNKNGANMVVDKNENMYINFFDTTEQSFSTFLYVFTYSNGIGQADKTSFRSTLLLPQITKMLPIPKMLYSSVDNSISYTNPNTLYGRDKIYLDTMAIFRGTIATTVLTVESVINGIIQLGSSIFNVVIASQTLGTPGGVGRYSLSAAPPNISVSTEMSCIRITTELFTVASAASATANTLDGLLNLGEATDVLATTNSLNNRNNGERTYDSKTNCIFFRADENTELRTGNPIRVKRIDLSSGQVVTMGGNINVLNSASTNFVRVRHEITSEKFPIEYGAMRDNNTQICDTISSNRALSSGNAFLPTFIGENFAYYVTKSEDGMIREIMKINNFRANPSCMSGPLSLNGTTVSMFIVYSNTNSNKNIMPHNAAWNTPIVSLSSTEDFCVFIGSISNGIAAGTFGTVLIITQIISGTVELGATINTPLGGFISSVRGASTTTTVGTGTYNISIPQAIPPGTRITASNGIGRVYTGGENATNGPTRGIDTMKQDFISLYTNNTNAAVYRNNAIVSQTIPAVERNVPSSGIMTQFTGIISGTTLTVTNIRSGVIEIGSIINIPGNATKPIVTAYGASTLGFVGTYTVEPSISVPAPTVMTTDTKATRFTASISGTTLHVSAMSFGIIQIGATVNITGSSAKPIITGYASATTTAPIGSYTIDLSLIQSSVIMIITDPIIPDILFLHSTPTGTTTRVLSPQYTTVTTTGATTTSTTPFKISSIGLGLQPSNISRIKSLLPNYFFDGTICEVLIYNKNTSTDFYKNQALEGYLAWKWNAQTKLPWWHLYRYNAPDIYIQNAIPTGPLTISNITFSSFTVSWPNNNITGNYSYFLTLSVIGGVTQTFTATVDGTNPKLNIPIAMINYDTGSGAPFFKENMGASKSITVNNLQDGSTYKLRIMSHGSLSFVNTDMENITTREYMIRKVAGTVGTSGGAGDNGLAINAQISTVTGIAVGSNGDIYLADRTLNNIRKITISDGIIRSFRTASPILYGIAVDSANNVYYSEDLWHIIKKITPAGTVSTIAGTFPTSGSSGDDGLATNALLNIPSELAVDSQGNLYFCEVGSNKIRKITVSTGIITTIAGTGVAGYDGDDGPARSAKIRLVSPGGICVDSTGDVYFSDNGNHRVRKITVSTGIITTIVGTGISGNSGNNGPGTLARLKNPNGICVDSQGDICIVERDSQTVRKYNVSTRIITLMAGVVDTPASSNDNISAKAANLWSPQAAAADLTGNVYVGDGGLSCRIRKIG